MNKSDKIKLIILLNANKVTGHLLHVNSDMILGREYLSMKRASLIDTFGAYVLFFKPILNLDGW